MVFSLFRGCWIYDYHVTRQSHDSHVTMHPCLQATLLDNLEIYGIKPDKFAAQCLSPDALSNRVTVTAKTVLLAGVVLIGLNSTMDRQPIKSGTKQKSMGTMIRKWLSSVKEKRK